MMAAVTDERQAECAVQRGDWAAAAKLFKAAADAVPNDVHGSTPADVTRLARRAHVANSMHKRLRHFGLERAFVRPEAA